MTPLIGCFSDSQHTYRISYSFDEEQAKAVLKNPSFQDVIDTCHIGTRCCLCAFSQLQANYKQSGAEAMAAPARVGYRYMARCPSECTSGVVISHVPQSQPGGFDSSPT